ncbi:MAG: peroxiredoxin [Rhodanobacter sp.]
MTMLQAGQTIPHLDIAVIDGIAEPQTMPTAALFEKHKVVMFGVPGAFTPTCSEQHLPGYVQQFDAFRARDIEVFCLAVNDAFVMQAWAASQHVPAGFKLLADGNGSFTRMMGLELDGSAYGMGLRTRRFALYAENGVVKLLQIEAPGELRVSSAEAMFAAIED